MSQLRGSGSGRRVPRNIIARSLVLTALVASCTPAGTAQAQRLDQFTTGGKQVDLSQIFETLARIGRFNVIVAPTVRGRTNLDVSDIPAEQALRLLSVAHCLGIQEVDNQGRRTFIIAPREVLSEAFNTMQTQILKLRYQDVATVLPTLRDLLKAYDVQVRGLEQQNILIIQGAEAGLSEAVDIINYLDLPNANMTIHLGVYRGNDRSWFTSVEAQNGHPVTAIVGPEDSPGTSALQYLSVELLPRVSPDNSIQIETTVKLSPPGGLNSKDRHLYNQLTTSTHFEASKEVRLASMVSPTGQILTFKVMVEVRPSDSTDDQNPAGDPPEGPPLPESDIGEGYDVDMGSSQANDYLDLPQMPPFPDVEIPDIEP